MGDSAETASPEWAGRLFTNREDRLDSMGFNGRGTGVPGMSVHELKKRLSNGHPLVLVDVREPFEREIADLPEVGQHRIPLGEFDRRVGELDADDPIVIYCRSGHRSAWATLRLRARGFAQAWNLDGGVLAWRDQIDPTLAAY